MDRRADRLRKRLVALSKPVKIGIAVATDTLLAPLALLCAFIVRLGSLDRISFSDYSWLIIATVVLTIPTFAACGLYRDVLRYIGKDTIFTLLKAVSISALLLSLTIYWMQSDLLIPRAIVFNYWVLLFLFSGGARYLGRTLLVPAGSSFGKGKFTKKGRNAQSPKKIAIYGAGAAGYQLFRSIQDDPDIKPVAFIDDNPALWKRQIGGLTIFKPDHISQLIQQTGTSEILLAIPSLSPERRKIILGHLEKFAVHVKTVPSVYELTVGQKEVSDLQEIRVEDILGRDVVSPDTTILGRCIENQNVMVTGAGGSIGSELCRQIIALEPRKLILYEHSEFNLFEIENELKQEVELRKLDVVVVPVLGSIVDSTRLLHTMQTLHVDTIYHAAAYKHVPIVEFNITAGVRNNMLGTLYTAQAAIRTGVERFVLVSTDKAVRPTNVMGASKRLSELILQALSKERSASLSDFDQPAQPDANFTNLTSFTIVRFGNVMESSGSVIPIFRKQIERGGPITVTHPDVTRYLMTIPEAAQLVIQAGAMGEGGEVFVLDMGEPVKILDLAIRMIHLSGQTVRDSDYPLGDIEIRFTGLRPGEKLHEELLIDGAVATTGHPKIWQSVESTPDWSTVKGYVSRIIPAMENNDLETVLEILEESVDGYEAPAAPIDLLFDQYNRSITVTASGAFNIPPTRLRN